MSGQGEQGAGAGAGEGAGAGAGAASGVGSVAGLGVFKTNFFFEAVCSPIKGISSSFS